MRCKHCGFIAFNWYLTFKYGLVPVCFCCVNKIRLASEIPVSREIVNRTRKMVRRDIKLGKDE